MRWCQKGDALLIDLRYGCVGWDWWMQDWQAEWAIPFLYRPGKLLLQVLCRWNCSSSGHLAFWCKESATGSHCHAERLCQQEPYISWNLLKRLCLWPCIPSPEENTGHQHRCVLKSILLHGPSLLHPCCQSRVRVSAAVKICRQNGWRMTTLIFESWIALSNILQHPCVRLAKLCTKRLCAVEIGSGLFCSHPTAAAAIESLTYCLLLLLQQGSHHHPHLSDSEQAIPAFLDCNL